MPTALFFEAMAWPPHLETSLELMRRHLDAGDRVLVAACEGGLDACDWNPHHAAERCRMCVERRRAGLDLVARPRLETRIGPDLTDDERRRVEALPAGFDSADALRDHRLDDFDLGLAVFSSLVSHLRLARPDVTEHADLVRRHLRAGASWYLWARRLIETERPDVVFVFNGRFTTARAVLRAARGLGVECRVHDVGATPQRFRVVRNVTVHDRDTFVAEARAAWDAADRREREAAAARFFDERRRGADPVGARFTDGQTPARLPASWDDERLNVVCIQSSELEFAALGPPFDDGGVYGSQRAAVRRIASGLAAARPDARLYVRLHPGLRTAHRDEVAPWLDLDHDQVEVIAPDDDVDSYALIDAADRLVTFGSTMSIEAAWRGKPVIVLGPSFYAPLGGLLEPANHDEVMAMILDPDLTAPESDGPRRAAYWFRVHGEPFRHYEAEGRFDGRFDGVRLPVPRRPGRGDATPAPAARGGGGARS